MFRNSDKEVLKELARDNYSSHKSRNRIAILAIALTTLLITAVWTVGISMISTISNYGESAPGPGCEGNINGTEETRQRLEELPKIQWADMARECSGAGLHNREFAGMDVRLLAPDKGYFGHNFVELIEGRFAQSADEKMVETPMTFTITGYYKNPLINISKVYDEIYTVPEFITQYNPAMGQRPQKIYVKLNNLNPLLMKTDVMNKLQEANDLAGGTGTGTKNTSSMGNMLLSVGPAILFVLFIGMSGYFLIYNVFYISVSSDIRWFGMMKTIGTTARQLNAVLMQQIRRLAVIGILIGIVLGYLVGNLIGPGVMRQTMYGMFYKAPNVLVVFLLGAGFSWFTVYISALKSLKLACHISPVEAARFAPKKKKNLFTILSFALSGMIFLVSCNAALGFSIDHMVERYNMKDARIFHKGFSWSLEEPYQPVSAELPEKISALPFVTNVDVAYQARLMPDYEETTMGRIYWPSLAQVSLDGALKKEMEFFAGSEEFMSTYGDTGLRDQAENNRWKLGVKGIPADLIQQELACEGVFEGTLDLEKFEAGEGIVWASPDSQEILRRDFEGSVHSGDKTTIGFYDVQGNCIEKEVTILAVRAKSEIYGSGDFGVGNIILSDTLFKELYPDYKQRISNIQIDTEEEITEEQHQQINSLMAEEYNSQLQLDSRYYTRSEMGAQKQTFQLIGFLLAGLLGIIGISNLVNTITSDVFSRKIELAAMQSIGMTRKQLWAMLLKDTLKFMSVSVVLMLISGGIMSYLVTQHPLFTGFNAGLFLVSAAALLLVVTGICIFMTWLLVKVLNKKTIVERLREIE